MLRTFDIHNHAIKGKRIIIYGAAMYGEIILNALQNNGLKCDFFCDRVQAGGVFCGIDVISPDELLAYKEAQILICATKGFSGIYKFLEDNNFNYIFEISETLQYVHVEKLSPYCRQLSMPELKEKYLYYLDEKHENTNTLDLSFVALSITERCSLKCKHCSVLAPYYSCPMDEPLDDIITCFSRFLNCIDSIAELQIGGGEPFMHKELDKILSWCLQQEKIKEISIFTNSTIIPNQKVLTLFQNPKIKLLLDDYGELSRNFNALVSICEEKNIRYLKQKFLHWDDLGTFDAEETDETILMNRFRFCSFGNVNSFMKGKLYRCTTAARLEDIGLIKDDPTDYVDFRQEKERDSFQKEIIQLLYQKSYHQGCRICAGISNSKIGIPVAEQIDTKHILQFNKEKGIQ